MRSYVLGLATVLLACASSSTTAQVYRCGASGVYTDKPCEGASAVDVRPNIMDAGPRQIATEPPPTGAPAIILPAAPKPPERSGSVWDYRDAAEAGHRSRTAPYRP